MVEQLDNPGKIAVQPLTQNTEFTEAVKLQKLIWGFDEIELLPLRLFVVATKVGGQAFGAYDQDRMVAFCLAIPGLKPGGKYYLHSHMLGVLPEYRNRGLGRLMKLAQRDDALARNIPLIEWTFDPLELKNAYFNLERLGAIVRRYVFNQYGTTSSPLHAGLPTDRCVAEWWLAHPRVEAILEGRTPKQRTVKARLSVPASIEEMRQKDPKQARAIQQRIGEEFSEHFRRGLAVTGFDRAPGTGTYLFTEWQ